jgi:hypothetical protein
LPRGDEELDQDEYEHNLKRDVIMRIALQIELWRRAERKGLALIM